MEGRARCSSQCGIWLRDRRSCSPRCKQPPPHTSYKDLLLHLVLESVGRIGFTSLSSLRCSCLGRNILSVFSSVCLSSVCLFLRLSLSLSYSLSLCLCLFVSRLLPPPLAGWDGTLSHRSLGKDRHGPEGVPSFLILENTGIRNLSPCAFSSLVFSESILSSPLAHQQEIG